MRFYRITITDSEGKPIQLNSFGSGPLGGPGAGIGSGAQSQPGVITSLMSNGMTNPAALNIELDIASYQLHQVGDVKSYVRIWGLGLRDISSALNLNYTDPSDMKTAKRIKVEGGMAKGYPLAKVDQQGVLAEGLIYQAFGNWVGTDMTLDLILANGGTGGTGSTAAPVNYSFTWAKGEQLSALCNRVLKQMNNLDVNLSLSQARVAPQDYSGTYGSLEDFAGWVQRTTQGQLGDTDQGVAVVISRKRVHVMERDPNLAPLIGPPIPGGPIEAAAPGAGVTGSELTTGAGPQPAGPVPDPKKIKFDDLMGQVTWIGYGSIQAKLVMRGDLDVSDIIRFPEGLISQVTAGSFPAQGGTGRLADSLAFGNQIFQIQQIQHWGNYRQPDAASWNTTIWAFQLGKGGQPIAQTPPALPATS
jgi:hypothetical protein